jgi:hypothetical protein
MRQFTMILFVALATVLQAEDLKPQMCERGKLLLSEDFTTGPLGADWRALKGKWEIADGALKGAELPADNHAAVLGRDLKCRNIVAQFDFKFTGAKSMAFSLNFAKGHVCRVTITLAGFTVAKDKAGKNSDDKGAKLDAVKCTFAPGEWHTMLVEVCGKEMLACVDGKLTGFGAHDGIDVDKTSVRFPVAGDSVSIKNVRIWEAQPASGWEAAKKKLEAAKKASK